MGSLLNTRGQSGPDMRDVAVFVSLSSPDNNMCQVSLIATSLEHGWLYGPSCVMKHQDGLWVLVEVLGL